jgi:hypothetical protein
MLGIPNYEPNFCDNTESFIKVFGENLLSTIGLTLDNYWLMWDTTENKWYNDGPVILKIADRQFEFTAYQLDEFSLTIDQIDLNEKLDWYGLGDDLPLIWKDKANSDINKLVGRKIKDIKIVAYNFISTIVEDKVNPENTGRMTETGFMLHGIEFEFKKNGWLDNNNFLQIFNALDANGVTTKELKNDSQFQKININNRTT